MRLYLKLSAAILVTTLIQLRISGPPEWVDETQFAIRVYVATTLGIEPQSPVLLDAADRLWARRSVRVGGSPPLVAPAVLSELPTSRADRAAARNLQEDWASTYAFASQS